MAGRHSLTDQARRAGEGDEEGSLAAFVFRSWETREYFGGQRNVWNTRAFRLLVGGTFLMENLISWHRSEQLPKLKNGNQRAVRLLPWRLQKEAEQRWKTSTLTAY
ncbi:hypothetical protein EYF80_048896 [Liparis tanakae]|uniref:Uncharacterized protein n=1 Tax=Liparis tanakae TaxID=230148 RepID=A0A4Z2FI90_9TELE|nr:hypothetical protein EYF80_048896 [Liparis tanakae]